jgi:guanosine-3',5'-bis(diphosphate) 3'-pyrophosphohydrolase
VSGLTGRDVRVTDEPVAGIVEEVTDTKWLQKGTRKRLQVSCAGRSSSAAKLVKLADKICNLRDILAKPSFGSDRRRSSITWTLQIVRPTERP